MIYFNFQESIDLGVRKSMDSKPLAKKYDFLGTRTFCQNFSLQLEVNLLESKLESRGTMAMIYAVFPLSPSFDSSRFTSN